MTGKPLPPITGVDPRLNPIDELAHHAGRVQALLTAANEGFNDVFTHLHGEGLQTMRSASALLGLAIDLLEPLAEHIDALPRHAVPLVPSDVLPKVHFSPKARAYIAGVQKTAYAVDGLMEGLEQLMPHSAQLNGYYAILEVAREKAEKVYRALDLMNFPTAG